MADELRRVRTQAERDADGQAWRAVANSRPGYATWPQTAPGDPSWWRRHDQQTAPTFEAMLSDPHSQFDPEDELLPHLLAFGPVRDDRPWLFNPTAGTTAVPIEPPVDGETCPKWCGFCHLNNGQPERLPTQAEMLASAVQPREPGVCTSRQPWICTPADCPGCANDHCWVQDPNACRYGCDVRPRPAPEQPPADRSWIEMTSLPPRRRWWHRLTRRNP